MNIPGIKKNLIIDIGHPANVHLFKYVYRQLTNKGWDVLFTTIDKDVTVDLLKEYKLNYVILGNYKKGLFQKISSIIKLSLNFNRQVNHFHPNIIVSRGSIHSSGIAYLRKIKHIILSDTESANIINNFSLRLVNTILTSTAFRKDFGYKQIRYPGYHELAYLHPNVYAPDSSVLKTLGVKSDEKYAIVRFVAWGATHDIGHEGISYRNKVELVDKLSKYLKVFISSEGILPEELKQYQIKINPAKMHDILYFAQLFIGEGATMASECAMLGTPAIFLNNNKFGCIDDQSDYGLIHVFTEKEEDQEKAILKAIELAKSENIKAEYTLKRDAMLKNKIDVTAFLVWFIENYPDSEKEIRRGDFNFDRFK
ncbi:MAG: DUF354 domain-containing protein [Candidatus Cloacimonadaceae bacterium]